MFTFYVNSVNVYPIVFNIKTFKKGENKSLGLTFFTYKLF